MTAASDERHCGRCGRTVPATSYSSGTKGASGHWVSTGSRMQHVPVTRTDNPAMPGFPVVMGVVEQLVETGYDVPGTPDVPWAPGRSSSDHGCESCRQVAESAYVAGERFKTLKRRFNALSPGRPPDLQAPDRPQPDRSVRALSVIFAIILGFETFIMVFTAADLDEGSSVLGLVLGLGFVFAIPLLIVAIIRGGKKEDLRLEIARYDAQFATYETTLGEYRQRRAEHLPEIVAELEIVEPELELLERRVAEHDRRQRATDP